MPAKSKSQRRAMGIALHHPDKLYKRNRGLRMMNKKQLHEFASTSEKGLVKSYRAYLKKKKGK